MYYVNRNLKQFVDPENLYYALPMPKKPIIEYGATIVLDLQLVATDGAPEALPEDVSFVAGIDTNFSHDDALMAYTDDIAVTDAAAGKLRLTINTNTEAFAGKITSRKKSTFELIEYRAGDPLGSVIVQDEVMATPRVIDGEGAPALSDPEYYTAAQTRALFAAHNGVSVVVAPELPPLPTDPSEVIIAIVE